MFNKFTASALVAFGFFGAVIVAEILGILSLGWICETFKEWQGLTGSVLAVSAALLTIKTMRDQTQRQLSAQREQEDRVRRQKRNARRAMLSVELSAILDYTVECMNIGVPVLTELRAGRTVEFSDADVGLPRDVLANLQNFMEYIEEDDCAVFEALLRTYQLQRVRFSRVLEDAAVRPVRRGGGSIQASLKNALAITLTLGAQTNHLLEYAWGDRNDIGSPADFRNFFGSQPFGTYGHHNVFDEQTRGEIIRHARLGPF